MSALPVTTHPRSPTTFMLADDEHPLGKRPMKTIESARRTVPLVALSLATALLAASPAFAQVGRGPDGEIDNFVHVKGTVTAPLGQLGHVEKRGNGPVDMLLIPGASFGWRVWEDFMARNADRYTMWAITPPGYDGTPPPPMPESDDFTRRVWSDALVESLARLVVSEGMDRPIVVGHHLMGDYYALRLGLEYPDRVGGVVVIAGEPTRGAGWLADHEASLDEKLTAVREQWKPFFKTVSMETWLNGTYKGPQFSNDAARGEELYQQQISTPLPIQIRYFLEFLTSSLPERMNEFDRPLLVLNNRTIHSLDEFLEDNRSWIERQHPLEEARKLILDRFGNEEEALDAANGGLAWKRLPLRPGLLEFHYVEDTGIFIMDDRPELLDRMLADWVGRLGG